MAVVIYRFTGAMSSPVSVDFEGMTMSRASLGRGRLKLVRRRSVATLQHFVSGTFTPILSSQQRMRREVSWLIRLVFGRDAMFDAAGAGMWAAPALKSFVQSVSARDRHPVDDEFFILSRVRPEGSVVGHLGDLPIPAQVIGEDGQHYVFEGVAPRRPSGRFDVRTLRPGEWIVQPGLVYRQID